ncbi:murein biosynthesis integral membrane protein MurJ [Thiotrichales bacterium 19S3-7]|nr:murein biosynthesis integral membrane protein MurJ [Thiotrichales bacterium 19S3-7]MCF6801606.1 murein biosynthesis integral membrane protein MurJ [Thiotrichales bacterium 19S3-11]
MSKRLLKSTFVFGSLTLLSRILGFVRDIVWARFFGATGGMEAFLVAFKIPNFMRRLFAEGSFTQAFVPVLSEYRSQNTHQEMVDFIRHVVGTLGAILLVLSAFGMMFSSLWVWAFAPGFADEPVKFQMAEHMLSITFPYIFLVSLTALAGSIMNCFERFAIPALSPVFLNISLIAFSWAAPYYFNPPVYALAWGVFVAGVVQLIFMLPFLKRLGVLAMPAWGWSHNGVKKIIKLMVPALFGASVAQISLLLDTIFASFLPNGSISWLYYSDRLNQFPLGVFGVALSTVVLPHLSKSYASKDEEAYQRSISWAFRIVLLLALPAALGLISLSGPLLVTLFHYGKFNVVDVYESQKSLVAFALGLFSFILVKVLVSAFYSRQNMKTPVKIGIFALFCNMILNVILVLWLMQYGLGHVGLALSTSLASFINAGLLYLYLKKYGYYKVIGLKRWLFLLRVSISVLMMVTAIMSLKGDLTHWINWSVYERIYHLVLYMLIAVAVYFIALWFSGVKKSDWLE